MGLLKKIFKPVSKVLDKIVPNEIKPFLPYAAAFAPMLAPGIMGAFGGSALSRAAIGGGLNIFGQLAQEGNEGDINLLSAGLGALTGAMTGPGAADKFSSMTTKGAMDPALGSSVQGDILANRSFLTKATDAGLSGLAKGSDMFAAGMDKPFSMAGLKAATLPAATATGDLMFAQAKRDQDEADRLANEEAENEYASDASRAFAIRQSMESYGFTEQEILDAIEAAGYADGGRVGFDKGGLGALGAAMEREPETFSLDGSDIQIVIPDNNPTIVGEGTQGGEKMLLIEVNGNTMMISEDAFYDKFGESKAKGGRVGLRFGGIGDAVENIEDEEIKESAKFAMNDMDIPIMDLVEEFEIQFKRKPNSLEELKQFYKDRYEYKGPGDVKMQENIKEKIVMEAKDGGIMNSKRGFVDGPGGYAGKKLKDVDKMSRRTLVKHLNQMELPETNASEFDDDNIRQILIDFAPDLYTGTKYNNGGRVGAEEGGLMNLGGKEMDLRKGGFVPIGKKERADDVPARLSKNEFVMTADAVRAAGGGSVNEGAKRMYETMNKLEARA